MRWTPFPKSFLWIFSLCCGKFLGCISQWLLFFPFQSHERIVLKFLHEKFVRFFLVKPTEVWKFLGVSPFYTTSLPVDSSTHQSSYIFKLSFKLFLPIWKRKFYPYLSGWLNLQILRWKYFLQSQISDCFFSLSNFNLFQGQKWWLQALHMSELKPDVLFGFFFLFIN